MDGNQNTKFVYETSKSGVVIGYEQQYEDNYKSGQISKKNKGYQDKKELQNTQETFKYSYENSQKEIPNANLIDRVGYQSTGYNNSYNKSGK